VLAPAGEQAGGGSRQQDQPRGKSGRGGLVAPEQVLECRREPGGNRAGEQGRRRRERERDQHLRRHRPERPPHDAAECRSDRVHRVAREALRIPRKKAEKMISTPMARKLPPTIAKCVIRSSRIPPWVRNHTQRMCPSTASPAEASRRPASRAHSSL